MRGHEGDHVTRECLVREGPKDKNSKVHYIDIIMVLLFLTQLTSHLEAQLSEQTHPQSSKIKNRIIKQPLHQTYIHTKINTKIKTNKKLHEKKPIYGELFISK